MAFYGPKQNNRPWQPISSAPADKEVEVQVNDQFGVYILTFPVRWTGADWVNAKTNNRLEVEPIHWREKKSR